MINKLVPPNDSAAVSRHEKIGAIDRSARIDFTIRLRRKSEAGLPTLDEFLSGQRASLTRQELGDRYGAAPEDADAVQSWAQGQGLAVSSVDLRLRQMHLIGSADSVANAFGVRLSTYKHARTGIQFRGPESAIQIPESLNAIISGVFGLNDMPVMVRGRVRPNAVPAPGDPKATFPGSFYPNEIAALYNFPPTKGDGQRVAILEFGGGCDPAVLADYFTNHIGLNPPPTVNAISVLNTPIQVGQTDSGEVYLDIEVVGAMAPKAVIDVYFAPWSGEGFLTAISQAIHGNDYAAISISFGMDEDARDTDWAMLHNSVDEAFRDAAAVGVPVFVSVGDHGSSSLSGQVDNRGVTLLGSTANVEYPSTSPYVTAVGGTMLYAEGGVITDEVVWNELGDLQEGKYYAGSATGGGVSERYTTVPSYQTGAGLTPQSANTPPVTGRGVPDVAGNAGATTGYLVSQPAGAPFPIAPMGGTSAATPMWAALMACVRESLTTSLGGRIPVFFFNDFVYAKGNSTAFRNIVGGRTVTYIQNEAVLGVFIPVGNNRSSEANGYSATPGYDHCTGWGSPNGVELLQELQSWLAAR